MKWKIDDLQSFVDFLTSRKVVYGPVLDQSGSLEFGKISSEDSADLSRRTDISARKLFQPQTHYYLEFQTSGNVDPQLNDLIVEERVLLGVRPCDMAGITVHSSVFSQSGSFRKILESTVIIGYLCQKLEPSCFCQRVGVSPDDTSGMDLCLFTAENGTLHVQALTDKGIELMDGSPFTPSESIPAPFPGNLERCPELPEEIINSLESVEDEAWDSVSFACVNCNVCTFVCPTCHCFTITDEVFRGRGGRAAVWDSCQSLTFTKEASGHNPRESKTSRSKQRILHKFSYYPSSHEGSFMCSGCGRCIDSCPSGRNLLEDLLLLIGEVV